jgi:hypothetical protein
MAKSWIAVIGKPAELDVPTGGLPNPTDVPRPTDPAITFRVYIRKYTGGGLGSESRPCTVRGVNGKGQGDSAWAFKCQMSLNAR